MTQVEMRGNKVHGWGLPSMGIPYHTCGQVRPVGCLNTQAHVYSIGSSSGKFGRVKNVKMKCRRFQCPICSRDRMIEETEYCVKRIDAGNRGNLNGFRKEKAIHVTISPPSDLYYLDNDNDFAKLRRRANYWLKKAGMRGYMIIYHPYRQNKEKEWLNTPYYLKWRYSPHFHVIGYGWVNWVNHKKGIDLNKQSGGWVVVNHRVRKSIGATVYYQLSHCGVKDNRKTVSWVGLLSWKKLYYPKPKNPSSNCPVCGNRWLPVKYVGKGSCPLEGSTNEIFEVYINDYMYCSWENGVWKDRGYS